MEEKILKELKNNNGYISGESLSDKFGVSRTAIWKHINNLKKKGYQIEGVSKKGYKLIKSADRIEKIELESILDTKYIGKNIVHYDVIDSTNMQAKLLGNKIDGINGTVVIAEKQQMGSGRFKRLWQSPEGGIWFSILLKPNIIPTECTKVTQISAAAMHKTLAENGIKCEIKWPNDIVLNNKKICGILTELKCDLETVDYLVVGIGLNVNIDKFDEKLKDTATSIYIEKKKKFNRTKILVDFLHNFEELYEEFISNGDISKTMKICRENSNVFGKKARIVSCNNEEEVTCIGISDEGNLIVKDENGNEKKVISGEITFKKQTKGE